MVTKQIKLGSIPKGIGVGLAASIASTIVGSVIAAWLIGTEKIGEGSIGYITMVLLLLSSITGAVVSFGIIKQKRLPVCLFAGGTYVLSLLAINALFFQGTYSGVGESALVILAGVMSVAVLGLKSDKKIKRRIKK